MKNLTILFLLLLPLGLFSQTNSAEKYIEKIQDRYQSQKSFSADIVFEIDIPESEKQIMKGKIYLDGDKYKFVLDDQEIISDNMNIWHWAKGDVNEVQVSYVENNEDVITPSKVFNEFLNGYAYKLNNVTTVNGEEVALIEIIPEKKDDFQDIFKIKVVARTVNNSIKQMQVFTKDGTVYSFKISNENTLSLKDSFFKFNLQEHKGISLIDLR